MRQLTLDQSPGSGLLQSLLEVLNDVVGIFDSDRQSDQAVRQAPFSSILIRNVGVGHRRRVCDHGFHTAQTFSQSAQIHRIHQSPPCFSTIFEFESNHPTESGHLGLGNIMLGAVSYTHLTLPTKR